MYWSLQIKSNRLMPLCLLFCLGFKPSMAPAPIDMVAFAPACFLGMTSPKSALEPKAAVTVALIRPMGGGDLPTPRRISTPKG